MDRIKQARFRKALEELIVTVTFGLSVIILIFMTVLLGMNSI